MLPASFLKPSRCQQCCCKSTKTTTVAATKTTTTTTTKMLFKKAFYLPTFTHNFTVELTNKYRSGEVATIISARKFN